MTTDYLAAGDLIVSHLKQQLPDLPVSSTWSLAEVQEGPELSPSLKLLLEGETPCPAHARGLIHKVEQRWCVVVITGNAETDAGATITRVLRTMAGWRPGDVRFSPFMRVPSRFAPDRTPGGLFYFPITFATEFIFSVE